MGSSCHLVSGATAIGTGVILYLCLAAAPKLCRSAHGVIAPTSYPSSTVYPPPALVIRQNVVKSPSAAVVSPATIPNGTAGIVVGCGMRAAAESGCTKASMLPQTSSEVLRKPQERKAAQFDGGRKKECLASACPGIGANDGRASSGWGHWWHLVHDRRCGGIVPTRGYDGVAVESRMHNILLDNGLYETI